MPDPLTVLLDAIHVEARWRNYLAWENFAFASGLGYEGNPYHRDSISGRNVFWATVIEGQLNRGP